MSAWSQEEWIQFFMVLLCSVLIWMDSMLPFKIWKGSLMTYRVKCLSSGNTLQIHPGLVKGSIWALYNPSSEAVRRLNHCSTPSLQSVIILLSHCSPSHKQKLMAVRSPGLTVTITPVWKDSTSLVPKQILYGRINWPTLDKVFQFYEIY